VILRLPNVPIHLRKNLIDEPDGMVFGNAGFERVGDQDELRALF
jgi:hypothetical protein